MFEQQKEIIPEILPALGIKLRPGVNGNAYRWTRHRMPLTRSALALPCNLLLSVVTRFSSAPRLGGCSHFRIWKRIRWGVAC